MQLVTGTKPQATEAATLVASTPAEKETGRFAPSSSRRRAQAQSQSQRQNVQRLARQVLLAAGERISWVLDDERVGELHAEVQAPPGGFRRKVAGERERVFPLEVLVEGRAGQADLPVAELLVEDLLDLLVAQKCRVQLHDRVEADLVQEEAADAGDLGGRAAVEG